MKNDARTRDETILFPRTGDEPPAVNGEAGEAHFLPSPIIAAQPVYPAPVPATVYTQSRFGEFDHLYIQRPRRGLILVLVAYLTLGVLFAIQTPSWQAPDEPAHYNYIAHIATHAGLPVLEMGDYDQDYLSLLVDTGFAYKLSVAPLRYENYQPPLYYLLATPVYWAAGGNLLTLRIFGVLIGAISLCLLYFCLETVFPDKTLIPLGATAFAALLPMHVAMLASVNNDGLAGMLLMAAMLVLLIWLRKQFYAVPAHSSTPGAKAPGTNAPGAKTEVLIMARQMGRADALPVSRAPVKVGWEPLLLGLGILLGLGMVTKIYAYVLLPISLAAVVGVAWLQPRAQADGEERSLLLDEPIRFLRDWRNSLPVLPAALGKALWVAVPAVSIALPMWARNIGLYGQWDFLGLGWHDRVVVGQIQTREFIDTYGWVEYTERAYSFTFKSFWGVFGWMGVFMSENIYTALLIFSGVIFMGVLWATVRFISGGSDTDMDFFQLSVLCLLGLILTAVTLSYLWYNMKFVQHQGRYFFWGLLPIGVIVALGWREVLQPLQGIITGSLAAVMAGSMLVAGYMTGSLDKWTTLSIGVIAAVLLLQPVLLLNRAERQPPARLDDAPDRQQRRGLLHRALFSRFAVRLFAGLRVVAWALPFLLLFLLDLMIPSIFIIPQLVR